MEGGGGTSLSRWEEMSLFATTGGSRQVDISALVSEFDALPVDSSAVPQERLDLTNRCRTSLFPWRGQFSPELIELLLNEYACAGAVVVDPFVGSGTTLFEAARNEYPCFGAEINPAAVVMASSAHFVNTRMSERIEFIRSAEAVIERHWPIRYEGGLFSLLRADDVERTERGGSIEEWLRAVLRESAGEPLVQNIVANTVLRFMAPGGERTSRALFRAFKDHSALLERMPYSDQPCRVFHCDARTIPLQTGTVDFIVTSPPYINVFNYHQNYRRAMELMGWDLLRIARSEFGSNRKNRGNRFLTVVQYAIDMLQALCEMRRIIRPNGRIVVVIGRESKVRGVSFRNGQIVAALAAGGAGLRLVLRQERKFKNKFGRLIYEDILHLVPGSELRQPSDEFGRQLARHMLHDAAARTAQSVRGAIVSAAGRSAYTGASPRFE